MTHSKIRCRFLLLIWIATASTDVNSFSPKQHIRAIYRCHGGRDQSAILPRGGYSYKSGTPVNSVTPYNGSKALTMTSPSQENIDNKAAASSFPKVLLARFFTLLFRGMTLPFPMLRELSNAVSNEDSPTSVVGFSLKECIVAIFSYSGLGVLAYTVLVEKWSLIDALYFSVVTFTTVGYGDVCPNTCASKLFTMVFGLLGISMLGAAIGTIGSNLIEAETKVLKAAEHAGRKRLLELLDTVVASSPRQLMSKLEQEGAPASQDGKKVAPVGWKHMVLKLINKLIPAVSVLVVGGLWMGRLEGWSWFDSLYYSIITAGTIGYGDFSPKTSSGRAWGILFIPLAVAAAGDVLGSVASTLFQRRQNRWYQSIATRELNIEDLLEMDTSKNGKVSREEYVQFMLREMQLVDDDQFAELHAQFERLDVVGNGYLDQEDLRLRKEQNAESET